MIASFDRCLTHLGKRRLFGEFPRKSQFHSIHQVLLYIPPNISHVTIIIPSFTTKFGLLLLANCEELLLTGSQFLGRFIMPLRLIHIDRKRWPKRKFSLMFKIVSLIYCPILLIFFAFAFARFEQAFMLRSEKFYESMGLLWCTWEINYFQL